MSHNICQARDEYQINQIYRTTKGLRASYKLLEATYNICTWWNLTLAGELLGTVARPLDALTLPWILQLFGVRSSHALALAGVAEGGQCHGARERAPTAAAAAASRGTYYGSDRVRTWWRDGVRTTTEWTVAHSRVFVGIRSDRRAL